MGDEAILKSTINIQLHNKKSSLNICFIAIGRISQGIKKQVRISHIKRAIRVRVIKVRLYQHVFNFKKYGREVRCPNILSKQLILVFSKSKGPSEIPRYIRTSIYQIC